MPVFNPPLFEQIGGNTTGTTALIQSGTLTLAGGNNITLSQASGNAITIIGGGGGIGYSGPQGNSAGIAQTMTSGTLVLAGGNNITLSQTTDGNGVTLSVVAGDYVQGFGVSTDGNTAGFTGTFSTGNLILVGGNNITLSQGAPYITINGPSADGGIYYGGIAGNTVGDAGTMSVGSLVLAGGGNYITLSQITGTNGHTVSILGATHPSLVFYNIGGNTDGDVGTLDNGSLQLVGAGDITLSQGTGVSGITLTISSPVQTVQTQNMIAASLSGNTAGVLALVSSGTLILAGGNNITLSQNGQSVTISGGAGGAGLSAGVSNAGNTVGDTGVISTGNLVFAGGNNITLSQVTDTAGATITVSAFNQTLQTSNVHNVTLSGNTAGVMAQVSSGTLTLAGGNNITLSQNGNAVTISGANITQSTQTQNLHNVTLSGNTAGVMAQVSSGTLTLAGGNNITLSQNGNAVTISGPNTVAGVAGGISNLGNTAGTSSTFSTGTIVFAGGNNVTLSEATGAGGATITISAFNQTTQTQNLHNVTLSGNTAGVMAQVSSGTLTLAGGNNITLSQNGNAVTISAFNQTTQTQNLHNVTLSGNTAGVMAQVSSGTLTLAGGNNITLSQNGNAVTISGVNTVAQTTQTQNLHNLTLAGNSTSAGAGYIQVSSGTLTLAGGNNITLSQNGNAITISAGAGAGGVNVGVSTVGNTAGSTGVYGTGNVVLAGGNNVTLSQSTNAGGATITVSAGAGGGGIAASIGGGNSTSAGAGYSNITSGTLFLAGGNNITLSQNGASITISSPNHISGSLWPSPLPVSTSASTYGSGSTSAGAGGNSTQSGYTFTLYAQPVMIPTPIVFSKLQAVISNNTSAGTGSATQMWSFGLYTLNGANLSLVQDFYGGVVVSQNSQTSVIYSVFTFSTAGQSSDARGWAGITGSAGSIASANGVTISSVAGAYAARIVELDDAGQNITLSGGNYWLVKGFYQLTSNANVLSHVGWVQQAQLSATHLFEMGAATNVTNASLYGWGAASTTFTSVSNAATFFPLPSSLPIANLSTQSTSAFRSNYWMLRGV